MRTVVLSGFMATGKSTVGPIVAARLGLPFIDTDSVLARESGRSVPDLWRTEGEAAFRAREAALILRLLADDRPQVVAFGGGSVTIRQVRHMALDRALVVTLTASPETLVGRIDDLADRPNLAGPDPVTRARFLLEQRSDAYAECHLALSTDDLDPESAADAIVALVGRAPLAVALGARSYVVDTCRAEPTRLTDAVAALAPSSVVLVSDSNVQRARGSVIESALAPLALPGVRVTLPAGERHKTLASVATIWDAALGAGVDRDALVVAAGGGVVGDLAGFAASALLRGVRVLQVPTSLLAMVDASVGGKTGFDHPTGKNLVGSFHQPSGVVADLDHLTTLPLRERISGFAEIVKIAFTSDAVLLGDLERDAEALRSGDLDALLPFVRGAIAAKARVVRDDERESGARALLNLGHTIGHAIEAHGGYARYLHGEAVAIGTVVELRLAARLGLAPVDLSTRASSLLTRLGLPTEVPSAELAASWPYVGADKKRVGDSVRFPVVLSPGDARIERVTLDALRRVALG
jgi:shikimate kinase/3-dehydroquinate synthase